MKGILFGGCSFTWGQGLYFYSELNRLVYPENEFTYNDSTVNDAHRKFRDTLRYPRLVANHFNTFEVFKKMNGGSEDETFDFFETIFNFKDNLDANKHLSSERYDYDDFDYIVIQISQLWRNKYYFNDNGIIERASIWPSNKDIGWNVEKLFNWLGENNMTIDDWIIDHAQKQIDRLKKELKFYEDKGIKTRIMAWEHNLVPGILEDEFLSERFIKLTHNDVEYLTIRELQDNFPHLRIKYDTERLGDNPPDDHHPSKECHEIIAKNIIKNIEKNLK
jgi:hypothetical protein